MDQVFVVVLDATFRAKPSGNSLRQYSMAGRWSLLETAIEFEGTVCMTDREVEPAMSVLTKSSMSVVVMVVVVTFFLHRSDAAAEAETEANSLVNSAIAHPLHSAPVMPEPHRTTVFLLTWH